MFIVIHYRLTDSSIYKKSVRAYTVAHSAFRGLRCPPIIERATQKPHADMQRLSYKEYTTINIPDSGIYCCFILDYGSESCEVSNHQERA